MLTETSPTTALSASFVLSFLLHLPPSHLQSHLAELLGEVHKKDLLPKCWMFICSLVFGVEKGSYVGCTHCPYKCAGLSASGLHSLPAIYRSVHTHCASAAPPAPPNYRPVIAESGSPPLPLSLQPWNATSVYTAPLTKPSPA